MHRRKGREYEDFDEDYAEERYIPSIKDRRREGKLVGSWLDEMHSIRNRLRDLEHSIGTLGSAFSRTGNSDVAAELRSARLELHTLGEDINLLTGEKVYEQYQDSVSSTGQMLAAIVAGNRLAGSADADILEPLADAFIKRGTRESSAETQMEE